MNLDVNLQGIFTNFIQNLQKEFPRPWRAVIHNLYSSVLHKLSGNTGVFWFFSLFESFSYTATRKKSEGFVHVQFMVCTPGFMSYRTSITLTVPAARCISCHDMSSHSCVVWVRVRWSYECWAWWTFDLYIDLINLGVDCIAPLVIGLLTQSTYFVCKKVRTDFTPLYYGMKEKATRRWSYRGISRCFF